VNVRRDIPAADDARVPKEVGARIRKRRQQLDLTLKQLGERLVSTAGTPIAQTQVSKWEKGRNLPAQRQWGPLADALNMEVNQLFSGLVDEHPDWVIDLERQAAELAARVDALIRLLGLEDAVSGAIRGKATAERRLDPDQVEQALEAERTARGSEDTSGASGSRTADD